MNGKIKHLTDLIVSVCDYYMDHMEIIEWYQGKNYQVVSFKFKEEYAEVEICPENGDHKFYFKENGILEEMMENMMEYMMEKDREKVTSILFLAVLVKIGAIEGVEAFFQERMERLTTINPKIASKMF